MQGNEASEMLGRIDGKLDQLIAGFSKHEDRDDKRFMDTYSKIDSIKEDINKAKGAKGAILWLIGGGAAAIGGLVAVAAKAFGVH